MTRSETRTKLFLEIQKKYAIMTHPVGRIIYIFYAGTCLPAKNRNR